MLEGGYFILFVGIHAPTHLLYLYVFFMYTGREKPVYSKPIINHAPLQDDDANSDSGLETESPIPRRKSFYTSSVKHTGMGICM